MLTLLYAAVLGVVVGGLGHPDWRTREWHTGCLKLLWMATGSLAVETDSPEVQSRLDAAARYGDGLRRLATTTAAAMAVYTAASDPTAADLEDPYLRHQVAALARMWELVSADETDIYDREYRDFPDGWVYDIGELRRRYREKFGESGPTPRENLK